MSLVNLEQIYSEWQNNSTFRAEFKKDPVLALKNAGFELSKKDLLKVLKKINDDNASLDERTSK